QPRKDAISARQLAAVSACGWACSGAAIVAIIPSSEISGLGSVSVLSLPDRGERVAVDLAVRVLRHRVHDDDGRGHLERHEPGAAVLEERRLNRVSPGPGRHESHRDLAVDLVAHAERTGVGDVRMLEQAIRDLERGDVDPALDDDVLLAAGDVDVAFLVAPREIAIAEPILRNRHELVRALPVRRGELPSADDHLALLAGRELEAGVVQNAHAHVQGRPPDGAWLAMPGMVATHEAGLGTAGELHDLDAVGLLELQMLGDGA